LISKKEVIVRIRLEDFRDVALVNRARMKNGTALVIEAVPESSDANR
jgi:hypothetical protein